MISTPKIEILYLSVCLVSTRKSFLASKGMLKLAVAGSDTVFGNFLLQLQPRFKSQK
jgi:hypothetical protein